MCADQESAVVAVYTSREGVLSSLSCLRDREAPGDGEESPEEEGPVSRSPGDAPAPTGS